MPQQKRVFHEELPNLKGDFDKIISVLAGLVGGVKNELTEIRTLLGLLSRYLGGVETAIINFSMEKARDAAWSFAEELSPLSEEQRQQAIVEKDEMFALFSNVIMRLGFTESLVTKIIRLGERGTTRKRIEILE